MKKKIFGASLVVLAGILFSVGGTSAIALTPNSGPTAGGTTIVEDVPAGVAFTQVSAGSYHSVAMGDDGNAYSWGDNYYGQLGDGALTNRPFPGIVPTPPGVKYTQVLTGPNNAFAIADDGNAYGWGDNFWGQLGSGTSPTKQMTPVKVQAPTGVTFTQISAGSGFTLAIGNDGNTYSWGINGSSGSLGDGGTTNRAIPGLVSTPTGVTFTKVYAGGNHSMALGDDNKLYSWGYNRDGQLGDGTTTDRLTPVPVSTPPGVTFVQIEIGFQHTLAIGSDGKTYAWGDNGYGKLGDGTTTKRLVPVPVSAPAGVTFTQIQASDQSLAIGDDGNTYAWGLNNYGQLGDGTTTDRWSPVAVSTPPGVTFVEIYAGTGHALAIGSDGNTYSWGRNVEGRLGNGTTINSSTPVMITGVTISGVSFAGVAGTNLVQHADGTFSIDTPPGGCGAVDVAVNWNQFGSTNTETVADGFSYGSGPSIIMQPVSSTVTAGETFSTSIGYTAGDPVSTVSWEESTDGVTWTPIPGETSSTLTITPAATMFYRAVISNCLATVTSDSATATLVAADVAPAIVSSPTSVQVTDGESASFSVQVAGSPVPSVAWEASPDGGVTWKSIAADTSAAVSADGLTVNVVGTAKNAGFQYRAVATNPAGSATSGSATLTVIQPVVNTPPIVSNPADVTVDYGDAATFSVKVSGSPAPVVMWEVSHDEGATWENVVEGAVSAADAESHSLTVIGSSVNNGFQYRAVATNTEGRAVSAAATLSTVSSAPAPTPTPTAVPGVKEEGDSAGLALTGSNADLPWIGLAAGIALLLVGAGTIVVRRYGVKARS